MGAGEGSLGSQGLTPSKTCVEVICPKRAAGHQGEVALLPAWPSLEAGDGADSLFGMAAREPRLLCQQ